GPSVRRLVAAAAALTVALSLLLHALRALAQRFERSALRFDRAALAGPALIVEPAIAALVALAVAFEVALGFLHVALRFVEALLALHAERLQPLLQFGETVAQRPLALVERRIGLIALALGRVAAELLALILAERVVA